MASRSLLTSLDFWFPESPYLICMFLFSLFCLHRWTDGLCVSSRLATSLAGPLSPNSPELLEDCRRDCRGNSGCQAEVPVAVRAELPECAISLLSGQWHSPQQSPKQFPQHFPWHPESPQQSPGSLRSSFGNSGLGGACSWPGKSQFYRCILNYYPINSKNDFVG